MGVGGGKEFLEEISGAGEMGKTGGGEFDASTVAQDDGTVGSNGESGELPIDFQELRWARADLAAVVVEGMDGDAEGGGVGRPGLASVSEFLGAIEELLTGYDGVISPLYVSTRRGTMEGWG